MAYIVDANVGRSSTAVATNSAFRGILPFVAIEVAIPLQVSLSVFSPQYILFLVLLCLNHDVRILILFQNSIGDGGMYTLWAGLIAIAELMIVLVLWRGSKWRDEAVERETKEATEQ